MPFDEAYLALLKKRIKGKIMHKLIDQLPTIIDEAWMRHFPEIEKLAALSKKSVNAYVFDAVVDKIKQEEIDATCHKLNICPHYFLEADVICYENDNNELIVRLEDKEFKVKFCPFCGYRGIIE